MQNYFLSVALACFCLSCTKESGNQKGLPLPATVFKDEQYGDHPEQSMDVYLPAGRDANTRALVIVHGGGWSEGDKSDFDNFISEFQRRLPGYALINLNYRLAQSNDHFFPTQENDVRAAMQFIRNKASDWQISTNLITIGISAGAHLVLLQGYKHADVLRPLGIVSFFGPVDLLRLYETAVAPIPWVLRKITNSTPDQNPSIFEQSSPIRYVTTEAPPTLMLHGEADDIVPLEQAEILHQKLQQVGVRSELIVYPGLGHGWVGEPLEDSFRKIVAFVRSLEK